MIMNKLFKFGAGLLSALMVFGSLGTVAFAADEAGVTIGDITASTTASGDYYNVTVNYSGVDTDVTEQLTIFAYDITNLTDGATEFDEAVTPVGWINQDVAAEEGQIKFKVAKGDAATDNIAAFNADSTILIKVGGTGITPDAKFFSFANAEQANVLYGDVDGSEEVDSDDAFLVLQHFAEIEMLEGDSFTAGDVDGSGELDSDDAFLILQKFAEIIDQFPVEE